MNVFNKGLVILGVMLVTAINADLSFANKGGKSAELRNKVEERLKAKARANGGKELQAEDIDAAFRGAITEVYPHLGNIKGATELMEALGAEYRKSLEAQKANEVAAKRLSDLESNPRADAREFEASREALRTSSETLARNKEEDLNASFENMDVIIRVLDRLNIRELAKEMKPLMLLDALTTLLKSPDGVINHKAIETLKDVLEKAEVEVNTRESRAIVAGEVGELSKINIKDIIRAELKKKFGDKISDTLLDEVMRKCFA